MRQLQVTVPEKQKKEAREVLEEYSSDFESSGVDKEGDGRRKFVEFKATVESDVIDDLTGELKDIEELESGDLSIRVIKQESLIEKGQQTRGGGSRLSQEELYSKAQESAEFSRAQWGLIAVSAAIAAYGLALDNVIVVIGAMMLAPLLSPFVSGALSLVVGDRKLMKRSFVHGGVSILIAAAVSFLAVLPFPVGLNPTLELVVSSSVLSVLLSLLVGAAAALTFSTGLRDQIAGVAVAIALVPPVASVGLGLKMGDLFFALHAATVAAINILAVLISGYATFRLLGVAPSTYYREREAERLKYIVPAALVVLAALAAPAVYTSYQDYQELLVEQEVRDAAEQQFGNALLEVSFEGDTATVILVGQNNVTEFRQDIPDGIRVEVRQLRTG